MSLKSSAASTSAQITPKDNAICPEHRAAVHCSTMARRGEMRSVFVRVAVAAMIGCAGTTASAGCREDIPLAHLIGQGPFCIFGFCLYDAQLWAAHQPQAFDEPFALLLTYRRTLKAQRLVDVGMAEIARLAQSPLAETTSAGWRKEMTRAFKEVAPGDELCGVFLPGRGARFYANGVLTTELDAPLFAQAFFRIWLDPDTRDARLRKDLLGLSR